MTVLLEVDTCTLWCRFSSHFFTDPAEKLILYGPHFYYILSIYICNYAGFWINAIYFTSPWVEPEQLMWHSGLCRGMWPSLPWQAARMWRQTLPNTFKIISYGYFSLIYVTLVYSEVLPYMFNVVIVLVSLYSLDRDTKHFLNMCLSLILFQIPFHIPN